VLDCLPDLKELFQRFVDGHGTFEELKQAVNREVSSSNDTVVRDFLSSVHRDGLLSNTHFNTLIAEITTITGRADQGHGQRSDLPDVSDVDPINVTVLNNRFVLGQAVGKGGMGVVYRARDMRKMEANDSDDVVAIKILSPKLREHPESLVALQREAKKAQKLAHPNIVTVYDFDRDGDIAYMTMEYLNGIPLSKIIKKYAPLSRQDAIRIINSIARGLSYAHKHNIVHSDLKPDNIFILADGTVKILDFGIARAFKMNEEVVSDATAKEPHIFTAFTPAYASCEIIANKPPTPKDDIYALGCVAHELLTGKHPYVRMSANKAKEKKQTLLKDKNLSPQEYRAIMRAIALDRDKRTASVSQFLRELKGTQPERSFPAILIVSIVFITIITIGGFYFVSKINSYEKITAKQAKIVNKVEINDAMKQGDQYLKAGVLIDQDGNDALSMYQRALKLDSSSQRAKSAIENVRILYEKQIQEAISSDKLEQAERLLSIYEVSFKDVAGLQKLKIDLNDHLQARHIKSLLDKAAKQESQKKYIKPANANAFDTYQKVLDMAPDDSRALNGISRLRKLLLAEAEQYLQSNKWEEAVLRAKDALLVSPGHTDAVAMVNRVKTLSLAERYQQIQVENGQTQSDTTKATAGKAENIDELQLQVVNKKLSMSQNILIETHIEQADRLSKRNRWYGAGSKNAVYHYTQILSIDPDSEYARAGLDSAWNILKKEIFGLVDANDFDGALDKLEKSREQFSPFFDVEMMIRDVSEKRDLYTEKNNTDREIALLLEQADTYIKAKRWTLPKGKNAMDTYLEVLKLDPENENAKSGLRKLKEIYIFRVKSKIESENWKDAGKILQHAKKMFPKSGRLGKLGTQLTAAKQEAERKDQEEKLAQRIESLYLEAEDALNKRRFVLPEGSNSYELYKQIASLEPGNSVAIRGMNEAKFAVFDQVERDLENKNYQLAYIRLNRLSELGVEDSRLNELRERLMDLAKNDQIIVVDKSSNENRLLDLLMFAQQQEFNGDVWPPVSNSAYSIYRQVLDLEPTNKTAKHALSNLFHKKISVIDKLIQDKKWKEAEESLKQTAKLFNSKSQQAVILSKHEELKRLKNAALQSSAVRIINAY
jgi:serine/threonine protein kinase